ncbi:MAG: hypothetical protein AAB368_02365, partial [bacterium]
MENPDLIYVADTGNHVIRRVSFASTGNIITTVAGNNVSGFSGDGGLATTARLNAPRGVLALGSGAGILIADTGNHVVRMVSPGGVITRVAGTGIAGYTGDGGDPLNAQLNNPYQLTMENPDLIYVADAGNHAIRRIVLSSSGNLITTVAGNGVMGSSGDGGTATSARLSYPRGVVHTGSGGDFYIADTGPGTEFSTTTTSAPPATNTAPQLAAAGGVGYESDGVDPDSGSWKFTYKVKYTDAEGDAPATGYPRVRVDRSGTPVRGSPFG